MCERARMHTECLGVIKVSICIGNEKLSIHVIRDATRFINCVGQLEDTSNDNHQGTKCYEASTRIR